MGVQALCPGLSRHRQQGTSKVAGRTRKKRESEPSPWYTAGVRSYFVDSMIESRRCRDKSQGLVTRSEGQTGGRWAPKIPEAEPVMEKGNCLGLPTGVQNVMSGRRESGSESGQSEPVARGLSDLQLPRIPVDKRPGYMSCKLAGALPRASSPGGSFPAFLGSQTSERCPTVARRAQSPGEFTRDTAAGTEGVGSRGSGGL